MAEKVLVKAEVREGRGKNINRRLRRDGKVPVVVYGGGTESAALTVELKDLAAIIRSETGVNSVFSLDVDGDVHDVIFQDRQIDGIYGRLLHADLRRFAKGEKIEMTVPVQLIGEPSEPLEEGGVVSQPLHEIKLLCEPKNTPAVIEVDLADLTAEHAIHVKDIKFGEGVEVVEDPETVLASVVIVKEADLEPQLEEGAEPEVVGEETEASAEEGAEEGGEE